VAVYLLSAGIFQVCIYLLSWQTIC